MIGTGFAGFHCLRVLERRLPAEAAELVAVNPADYMLYVPLLPEVAGTNRVRGSSDRSGTAMCRGSRMPPATPGNNGTYSL